MVMLLSNATVSAGITRLAVDMKFAIHIHIYRFSVDIHGYIHIHRRLSCVHIATKLSLIQQCQSVHSPKHFFCETGEL